MEMHMTPITTPASPVASSGGSTSSLRHRGSTAALRTAGGGRRAAEHAGSTARWRRSPLRALPPSP